MREVETDVLVVGAGPAGIAAACAAADAGARVDVVDASAHVGGQIWRPDDADPAPPARPWIERAGRLGVRLHGRTTVVHAEGPGELFALREAQEPAPPASDEAGERPPHRPRSRAASAPRAPRLAERERSALVRFRCRSLVLATGARERFLPFPGWTLPGVLGAGGLQALAKGGWPVRDRRVVVAGTGPLLLAVADWLRSHGAHVVALVEQAPRSRVLRFGLRILRHPAKLRQAAGLGWRLLGTPRRWGSWPARAEGDERLESVVLRSSRGDERVDCDLLACGFGLVPDSGLAAFLGCRRDGDRVRVDPRQRTSVENVWCAGEPTGIGGVDLALLEGSIAGASAAGHPEKAGHWQRRRRRERSFARALEQTFALREELRDLPDADTVVCRCEDVPWGRVRDFGGMREAKLATRCGMGPCQARVCGPALRFLAGWDPDRVRPPFFPVSIAALAELPASARGETPTGTRGDADRPADPTPPTTHETANDRSTVTGRPTT